MLRFDPGLSVFIHREPVDFRLGLNGLLGIIEHQMRRDPYARALFVFGNRARSRIRLVLWDRCGFWLMMKRLEEEKFSWPSGEQSVIELDVEQLQWLLRGFDLRAMKGHRALTYQHAA